MAKEDLELDTKFQVRNMAQQSKRDQRKLVKKDSVAQV
jgi:hypothetical protein